jgi:hypothetical protein
MKKKLLYFRRDVGCTEKFVVVDDDDDDERSGRPSSVTF